jgi:signal transduction histidine kinase
MDEAGAGFNLLAKLREDTVTAAIPFILMTGRTDPADMRHGMTLGADDYLFKPFKMEELQASVQARLRKAKTVRESAERKLTSLRTQISQMLPHEMRTPLNGIISNAELLASSADTLDTATIAEMGQEICLSGQRLERLIENFLFYARLEIVAMDAENIVTLRSAKTINPGEIARAATMDQAERIARLADLTLDLTNVPLPMDVEYFKKIVVELTLNAFKFSEHGTPVRVSLKATESGAEFSVHNHGRTFSTEQIHRIDAYVQFGRNMQDEQGLGLGLAITKKLAELHGGELIIVSGKETGTTVTLKLPRVANGGN